ncbi:MAG: flavin reductase family protein, partial [Candidatus Bathyarchaeia archaeon]
CVVRNKIPLGSHNLFLGEIICVHVDKRILNDNGVIDFTRVSAFVYNQGEYWNLKKKIGTHGFSTR